MGYTGGSRLYGFLIPLFYMAVSYSDYALFRNHSFDEYQLYPSAVWAYVVFWFLFSRLRAGNKTMRFLYY